MYKIIEKVKGWARPGSYATKQDLGELVYALEKEFLRRTASDFAEACDRADLTRENKELKAQIKDLQERNTGLSIQKQILDNISHVGHHPDYVQELKEQIEELNVKLAKEKRTLEPSALDIGMIISLTAGHVYYRARYKVQLQRSQELEAQVETLKSLRDADLNAFTQNTEALKKHLDQALMYKAAGAEKEIEALRQINAAILDVVAAQKDYTYKLEAALGAYGVTKADVEKPSEVESRGVNKDFW